MGSTYSIVSPFVGTWVDKNYVQPRVLIIIGCILEIWSLTVIGPAPFLPFQAYVLEVMMKQKIVLPTSPKNALSPKLDSLVNLWIKVTDIEYEAH